MTTEIEFDALHAGYLAAFARANDDSLTEAENLEANDEDDELMRRLCETPAVGADRIDVKVQLALRMMHAGSRVDGLDLAMLKSIRADLARL